MISFVIIIRQVDVRMRIYPDYGYIVRVSGSQISERNNADRTFSA
jgi:hypothetical protein